jgi:hypothetical protein
VLLRIGLRQVQRGLAADQPCRAGDLADRGPDPVECRCRDGAVRWGRQCRVEPGDRAVEGQHRGCHRDDAGHLAHRRADPVGRGRLDDHLHRPIGPGAVVRDHQPLAGDRVGRARDLVLVVQPGAHAERAEGEHDQRERRADPDQPGPAGDEAPDVVPQQRLPRRPTRPWNGRPEDPAPEQE